MEGEVIYVNITAESLNPSADSSGIFEIPIQVKLHQVWKDKAQ